MNNIIPFQFENTEVRVVNINNEAWFIGSEVAKALGYSNPQKAVQMHCKAAENYKSPILGSLGIEVNSPRGLILIPERDVYRLIMRSKLPSAEQFEEKVVSEILPSIRKTGGYLLSPGQYGGITKSVVNKAVAILRKDFEKVYRDVEFLKTSFDPSAAFVTNYKPIIAVLKEKNVPQKGRRTLSCRCSGRIHRYLIRMDKASMIQISRETGRYIYHIDGIREWLGYEG